MSEHYIVRVYESELELITDETSGHHELETGGNLFGLFSHGGGPTVFLATRPAGKVGKSPTSLALDPEVTRLLEQLAWERFGVQSIGMWHSHHWIGLMEPSRGDRERTRRSAERYHRPQYTEILANFVGVQGTADTAVQLTPFLYVDARKLVRAEAVIQVLPGVSPLRRALAELDVRPPLTEALRPPGQVPAHAYRLAASQGTAPTRRRRRRRRLPGQGIGEEPGAGIDEVADDRPEEPPQGADAPQGGEAPPADGTAAPDGAALPAPAEERVDAGPEDAGPEDAGPGPVHPDLRPIPDLADYVVRHVQPVTGQLPADYQVELEPSGEHEVFVIVRLRGGRSQAVIRTGWDGRRAVATHCRIQAPRSHVDWPPGLHGRTFELHEPLSWSIQHLGRLP